MFISHVHTFSGKMYKSTVMNVFLQNNLVQKQCQVTKSNEWSRL